jgi:hypothetical protein
MCRYSWRVRCIKFEGDVLQYLRQNRAVPTGLSYFFLTYPGLRFAPSWANCNSTPSGFYFRESYSAAEDQT